MKLHIPVKLLSALLACLMHSTFAAGVITIPENAADADIAAAKAELATPTLTWLYEQDPSLAPNPSSYQLEEVTFSNTLNTTQNICFAIFFLLFLLKGPNIVSNILLYIIVLYFT